MNAAELPPRSDGVVTGRVEPCEDLGDTAQASSPARHRRLAGSPLRRRIRIAGCGLVAFCGASLASLHADPAQADAVDRLRAARAEWKAREARVRMERVLADEHGGDAAAEAGIWLGQYEYALGRLESAFGYFERALELVETETVAARARFWACHAANLLGVELPAPGPEAGGAMSFQVAEELARGDARVRARDPEAAMRTYLEAEGRARSAGWLGPLAYRAALVAAAARESGEKTPLFSVRTIQGWDGEIAAAPERGLVFARIREGESGGPSRGGTARSEFLPSTGPVPGEVDVESRKWGDGEEGLLTPERLREEEERSDGRGAGEGDPPEDLFVIQLGAFRDRARAREEMERYTARGLSVRLEESEDVRGEDVYRIRLGRPQTREEAERMAARSLRGFDYQLVPVVP